MFFSVEIVRNCRHAPKLRFRFIILLASAARLHDGGARENASVPFLARTIFKHTPLFIVTTLLPVAKAVCTAYLPRVELAAYFHAFWFPRHRRSAASA